MTRFEELFIKNLRTLRTQKGLNGLRFARLAGISPNYLNAVEHGKNFPSPEVLQRMADVLGVAPYQLFLDSPTGTAPPELAALIQELVGIKQQFIQEMDEIIMRVAVAAPVQNGEPGAGQDMAPA